MRLTTVSEHKGKRGTVGHDGPAHSLSRTKQPATAPATRKKTTAKAARPAGKTPTPASPATRAASPSPVTELAPGVIAQIVNAVALMVGTQESKTAGRLIPGVISNLSGAIIQTDGTDPAECMVFLEGSTTAVPVYIPPQLLADVAVNQEVWVEPINGNMDDLHLHSIRNLLTSPASTGYETSSHASATYETIAHAAATYGLLTSIAGLAIATAATTINGTTAGTAKWAMPLQGAGLKMLVVIFAGYRNSTGTPQNFVLPTDFADGALALVMTEPFGGTGLNPKNSGGSSVQYQSASVGSGGNPGSFTGRTGTNAASVGFFNGNIHSIDLPISNTQTANGVFVLIGF
jgi:hypothetical protein